LQRDQRSIPRVSGRDLGADVNQICPYHWLHMTQKTCWESMSLNVHSLCQPEIAHTRLQNASCSEVFTAGHLPCSQRMRSVRAHAPASQQLRRDM
jgi:hypothetical protein